MSDCTAPNRSRQPDFLYGWSYYSKYSCLYARGTLQLV